jgi:hypothetical protein
MEGLLKAVFSAWSVPMSNLEENFCDREDKISALEAVKIEPERMKVKNLHC